MIINPLSSSILQSLLAHLLNNSKENQASKPTSFHTLSGLEKFSFKDLRKGNLTKRFVDFIFTLLDWLVGIVMRTFETPLIR